MKNLFLFLLIFIFLQEDFLFSQIKRGNKELSVAASYMSRKFEEAEEAWTALNLSLSFGYFLINGLEIEPELIYSNYKEENPGWILSGNIVYNIQADGESNNLVPFF